MKKLLLLISIITTNAYSQTPNWQWVQSAGGSDAEDGNKIASDAAGNIYMTGNFRSSTVTFGNFVLTNAGNLNEDMFIVKYDSGGAVLWAKSAGASGSDRAFSISVDKSGNIYVVGSYNSSTITFGTTTLTNTNTSYDMFFVKYDVNGNVIWAKSIGGTNNDFVTAVKADTLGTFYAAGYFFSSNITFNTTTITNSGSPDVFIAKFDINGNAIWAKSAIGTAFSSEVISGITTDNSGNCYVIGNSNSTTLSFDSFALTTAGNQDLFVVKYSGSGNVLWAKREGGTSSDRATYITTDNTGNYIYVSAAFESTNLTIGSTSLTNNGATDMLVAKYDLEGNAQWAKSAGGIENDYANSITVDTFGNTYIIGYFESPSITFGSITLNNATPTMDIDDMYLVKYDSNGNALWAFNVGGTNRDYGFGVTITPPGNLYVAGYFYSPTLNFGTIALSNAGGADVFLAKLSSTTVGLAETKAQNKFSIYPNPANKFLTVQYSENIKEVKIINVFGQEVYQTILAEPTNKYELSISNLSPGIYFIQLKTSTKTLKQKFSKL